VALTATVAAVDREEIAARVDRLAREHEGEAFVAAVEELASGLDQEERDVLGAVLLDRSRALQDAAAERSSAKGWIRRTLDVDAHLQRRASRDDDR
jgi:hypothetical protein